MEERGKSYKIAEQVVEDLASYFCLELCLAACFHKRCRSINMLRPGIERLWFHAGNRLRNTRWLVAIAALWMGIGAKI